MMTLCVVAAKDDELPGVKEDISTLACIELPPAGEPSWVEACLFQGDIAHTLLAYTLVPRAAQQLLIQNPQLTDNELMSTLSRRRREAREKRR